jgi:formamidopyrimidine-DNA glycosylase
MPELPEVETWRRLAHRAAVGKKIVKAYADLDLLIYDRNAPSQVAKQLKAKTITGTERRGKRFWLTLSDGYDLYIHFGMTGSLWWLEHTDDEEPSHIKLRVHLSDGSRLIYRNMRRIGKIRYLQDARAIPPVSKLGPDPVEESLTLAWMKEKLSARKAPIKAVLLDQAVFAGVGNWIADEILYQAKIAPQKRCVELSAEEIKRIRTCMMRILKKGVEVNADASRFPKKWLFHYRWGKKAKTDAHGDPIQFDQVGGRTTAWVPTRQL